MRTCVFCGVVSGETAAHVVYEDDRVMAFLDHRPIFPGHLLLVPRLHVETLPDLPDVAGLFSVAQVLCRALEAFGAEGSFVGINNRVSQSVPHLHVHVVPRRRKDGLRGFFWPRTRYGSVEEMDAVRDRLRAAIASFRGGNRALPVPTAESGACPARSDGGE